MYMHALPLDSLLCPCDGRSRFFLSKFENGSVASWRYLSKRPPLLYGHHFPLILMYMKVSYEWDALLSQFTTCTAAISDTGSLTFGFFCRGLALRGSRSPLLYGLHLPFKHNTCEICSKFGRYSNRAEHRTVPNLNLPSQRRVPPSLGRVFQLRVSATRVAYS